MSRPPIPVPPHDRALLRMPRTNGFAVLARENAANFYDNEALMLISFTGKQHLREALESLGNEVRNALAALD